MNVNDKTNPIFVTITLVVDAQTVVETYDLLDGIEDDKKLLANNQVRALETGLKDARKALNELRALRGC